MAKLTLNNLSNLQNEISAVATINLNNDTIETAFENTLSRDGTSPNTMFASLDMNSNRVLNLPNALSNQEPVTLFQLNGATAGIVATASFVTLGPDAVLANERVLTMDTGLNITDGGAGSTVTLSIINPALVGLMSVTTAADTLPYFTGVGLASSTAFPAYGRSLVNSVNTAAAIATLGAATVATTQTLTNKTLTAPVITSPTGIVKSDIGLSNVDNTSDATKNTAVATLTNKTLTSPTIAGGTYSGTLGSATGLPIAGISGLGAGVGTMLGAFSSANILTACTDEVGSGFLVFNTAPAFSGTISGTYTLGGTVTIASPTITGGTYSGTLASATGLPVSTGVSGLGSGVATMLGAFSSANIVAACTDEVGSGSLVFNISPAFSGTITGTYTIGGSLTIAGAALSGTFSGTPTFSGANFITNANRAQMAAYTIKGNATGSTANEADIDITALTSKASPASSDIVLIQDSAASNAFKKTTVGALASAGSVASIAGNTGAFTLNAASGLSNSGNDIIINQNQTSWTPVITAATPGNLSVSYTTQSGSYIKTGKMVVASFTIVTSAFTWTTASGAIQITGLPFAAYSAMTFTGALRIGGWTHVGYTQAVAGLAAGASLLTVEVSGSSSVSGSDAIASFPSGGSVLLTGTIVYFTN